MKYIDVKYHLILYIMLYVVVSVNKIATTKNISYILTNPISKIKFKHCLNLIGLNNT